MAKYISASFICIRQYRFTACSAQVKQFGFNPALQIIIKSYPCNKANYAYFNVPLEFLAASRTPHGSNFGQLFFTIIINDVLARLTCDTFTMLMILRYFPVGTVITFNVRVSINIHKCASPLLDV